MSPLTPLSSHPPQVTKNNPYSVAIRITLHNVSTPRGVQYNGGCSVHQGNIMTTVGDIMSTLGEYEHTGGYHDKCQEGHWEDN